MWLFYGSSTDGKRLVHSPLKTSLGNRKPSLLRDFMRGWLDGLPLMIKYVHLLSNRHFLTLLDHQSIDVIDSPELRELLLYISPHLDKVDIPHRTKLSELITMGFKREYFAMLKDIEVRLHNFCYHFWC